MNQDDIKKEAQLNNDQCMATTDASANLNLSRNKTEPLQHEAPLLEQPRARRQVLKVALGTSLITQLWPDDDAQAAKPPEKMRPQPGDWLVRRFGDNKGQPITPDDVPGGAELLEASAMDPVSQIMRDKSRLNGINLVRINTEALDEQTSVHAAAGIVAYSSVCTHQGCDLTQWLPDTATFKCYCHYSEFKATSLGKPMHGPATRKLAILPITLNDNNQFIVAEKFQGKVGFKK